MRAYAPVLLAHRLAADGVERAFIISVLHAGDHVRVIHALGESCNETCRILVKIDVRHDLTECVQQTVLVLGLNPELAIDVNAAKQLADPPDVGLRKGTRPGWDGACYDHMRRVLADDAWASALSQAKAEHRAGVRTDQVQPPVRPVQTKRPGRRQVGGWRLIAATHNLLKLHSHWIAAEPA